MTEDEKRALMEIAGPVFAQAKGIDEMFDPNHVPTSNGMNEASSSFMIKQALEREFRKSRPQPPMPPSLPPQTPIYQQPYEQPQPIPQPPVGMVYNMVPEFTTPRDVQLELPFSENSNLFEETNRILYKQEIILRDIRDLLKRLVVVLEQKDEQSPNTDPFSPAIRFQEFPEIDS